MHVTTEASAHKPEGPSRRLYTQAELDAAVAAERGRHATLLKDLGFDIGVQADCNRGVEAIKATNVADLATLMARQAIMPAMATERGFRLGAPDPQGHTV